MDLHTVTSVVAPREFCELPSWTSGDAWLAGGTWLFSEPQPHLRRLIDLSSLGWTPATITDDGLSLAGTCTIAQLERLELPQAWIAAPLIDPAQALSPDRRSSTTLRTEERPRCQASIRTRSPKPMAASARSRRMAA